MNCRNLAILLLLIFPFIGFSQTVEKERPNAYVRIKLSDLTSWDQASAIDQLIRSKPGVYLTRTDQFSDTFLAFFTSDGSLVVADFEEWITSLGFQTLCAVSGFEGELLKELPQDCNYNNNVPNQEQQR